MTTFLVVILLALLTPRQSRAHLQRSTAENDTIILSELAQANIFETALVTRDLARRMFRRPSGRQPAVHAQPHPRPQNEIISVSLERRGSYWIARATILSKPFDLMIDTDSPCFWIKWDPSKVLTLVGHYRQFHCPGRHGRPMIHGPVFKNSMRLGTKSWVVEFAVTKHPNSVTEPYSGVLGLSLPKRPTYNFALSILQEIHFVRHLRKTFSPFFALYLAPTGSKLHIGGPHSDYYVGSFEDMEVHDVEKDSGRWKIGPAVITLSTGTGPHSVSGIMTVFDSSVEEVFGPSGEVVKIYQALRGGDDKTDLTFPCDGPGLATFKWNNGRPWLIDREKFILRQIPGTTSCEGIIRGGSDDWIVGTRVTGAMYVLYEASEDKPRIRLGELYPPHYHPPSYNQRPPPPPPYSQQR
ncbi:hypothetical protein APHAL10511_008174 [Amanita phalloides]|nr:hypothetical protein APHAL10511_008174 [Amanita phalloides]